MAVATLALLTTATLASAHTTLRSTNPEEGATVETLTEVQLEFEGDLLEIGTELSTDQVHTLRGIIEDSGARADVEDVIGHLTRTALAQLEEGELSPEATTVLTQLARAATERTI